MLYRKAYEKIKNWYVNGKNKALLVDGARQIGKTYIIKKYLQDNNFSFVEFNLLENDAAKKVFETSSNAEELLLRISSLTSIRLEKGKTIIFIDEVQCVKEIITKVKFLVEEASYRYIFSGSILGVELENVKSLPVGYMDTIDMYPLDFEEFAIANGVSDNVFKYLKNSFDNLVPIDEIIHERMLKLFNLYLVIGGLPEAVSKYLETNNLQEVAYIHETIDKMYRKDISKYDEKNSLLIKDIYDLIPSELNNANKRFILKRLNEKARFYQYEESFNWLIKSNIGLFVYNIDNPVYPLLASKERTLFKLFLCDCGLLCYKTYDESVLKILNGEVNVNFGAIYEAVVAQELKAHNFSLFYYNNKRNGEVDFIIQKNNEIIPIEVKSGKDYRRHVALDNLLGSNKYQYKKGYTLSNSNIEVDGMRIYLPIYMIMFIDNYKNIEEKIFTLDIDILKE